MIAHIAPPFWRSRARRRLAVLFERTILEFWRPRALAADGGYHLDFDAAGNRLPRRPATLIAQSRMLYFFSRVSRSPYADAFSVAAAHAGFSFLQTAMHDADHGGYFWDVRDRDAAPDVAPVDGAAGWRRTKHLCGQAFALMALSEYARSFRLPDAIAAAESLFGLIERHAADPAGGYHETLARDWSVSGAAHRSLLGPYPGDAKTSGMHIQLLEAFTALDHVAPSAPLRAALARLELLLDEKGTPGPDSDWSNDAILFADYHGPGGKGRLLVGHCIKEFWFRLAALERLGTATPAALGRLRRRFEQVLAAGYDRAAGGFFDVVHADGLDRTKYWWGQAEGLLGCLLVHARCGGAASRRCFLGTLDWIERHQADWQYGEWHAAIAGRRVLPGDKGGPWKTAYHTGRAMLDGMDLLAGG